MCSVRAAAQRSPAGPGGEAYHRFGEPHLDARAREGVAGPAPGAAPARPAHDPAAPARARRRPGARPRHAGADLRAGAGGRTRGEHHHRLPHPRPAGADRGGAPHPPRPRRSQLLRAGARARAPGLPRLRHRPRGAHRRDGRAGRPAPRRTRLRPRRHPRRAVGPVPPLRRGGRPMTATGSQPVPAHRGDPFAEQRAMARSAAVVDRSDRGVIAVTGDDRLSWLHLLLTQHVSALPADVGTEALVLDANGRVLHHVVAAHVGDAVYLDTEPGEVPELLGYLTKMVFWSKVEPRDAGGELAVLSVVGPDTPAVLTAAGVPVPDRPHGALALPGSAG